MTIELDHIIPTPLKERLIQRVSDVWKKQVRFEKGQLTKIKAPSGTGKTTLVHLLYKLRNDFEGSIRIEGKDISEIRENELAEIRQKKISIVFQDLRLFHDLTARENIEIKRVLQTPLYESSMIGEMAAELGVSHIMDQRAGLCSYGEQQRVAIIRALIHPFDILILDEPFSHLDRTNTQKATALIMRECAKRNAGLVITDLEDDDHFEYSQKLIL